jgi:3',5'-cyclic AMP phosphodiesterase CpdA
MKEIAVKRFSSLRLRNFIKFVLIVYCTSCTHSKQQPFSFIQLCDPQLGMGAYEHDLQTFKQAVKQINELDVDFVIICGDLVHEANDCSYVDFKNIKEGLEVPCYLISGNHDVGNPPNDSTLNDYRKNVGEDYYVFQHKGYSFILTNTQLWKTNVENESEKHNDWFLEILNDQTEEQLPVFVVGHYPLFTELPDENEHYFNIPLEKRKELLTLFGENNVKAYLSGHVHKLLINSCENIQLVSGETTSKNFDNRPFGFRLWQVSADTIKHHFVALQPVSVKQGEILKD